MRVWFCFVEKKDLGCSKTFINRNICSTVGILFGSKGLGDWSTTTHTSSSPIILFHPPSKPKKIQLHKWYNQVTVHFIVALPASFKEELKNQEKNKGETVTLCCKLSKPMADIQWKKGSEILKAGEKYEMKQKETSCELQIKNLKTEDNGEYSCLCGDQKTSATVKVNGMDPWSLICSLKFCVHVVFPKGVPLLFTSWCFVRTYIQLLYLTYEK